MVIPEFTLAMGLAFAIVCGAVILLIVERTSLELTSLGTLCALLVAFHLVPVLGPDGENQLGPRALLAGFADPALISVMALLVIGQGLVQTSALEAPISRITRWLGNQPIEPLPVVLLIVMVASALVNNTPVVVIAIPILAALAHQRQQNPSRVMMPLSYAAILGGMTTLIGTSPNLLISSTAAAEGLAPLGFFEFTPMAAILAGIGLVYLTVAVPRLMRDKASNTAGTAESRGKQFIAQLQVHAGGSLVGERATAGLFPGLPMLSVRMIRRGTETMLPPFDEVELKAGDVMTVAATRRQLTEAIANRPDLLSGATGRKFAADARGADAADLALAEVTVPPTARLIGRTLDQNGFLIRTNCAVLAIERRNRMIPGVGLTNTPIEAGDVLLIVGRSKDIAGVGNDREVLLLEASSVDLPSQQHARRASLIFWATILAAVTQVVPIVVAATVGACLMVATGCLRLGQALRAIEARLFFLIGAALAMGVALKATGGAMYLAQQLVHVLEGQPIPVLLSAMFLFIAVMTNLVSNAAAAVLFTPIAIGVAQQVGTDPRPFLHATVFAVSCSFASPVGYQTNLLVMGPGHYRFADFVRAGAPLVALMWISFSLIAPWYYGL